MAQCRIEWLSWARADGSLWKWSWAGDPLCLCPNWVSRFLLTLLPARRHGNSLREERETSFNHHTLQSEYSAPETSQETRTNAHREAPWAPTCEKGLGLPPPPPGEEGRHTDPEGWGLALFAVGYGAAMSDWGIWPYPGICRPLCVSGIPRERNSRIHLA